MGDGIAGWLDGVGHIIAPASRAHGAIHTGNAIHEDTVVAREGIALPVQEEAFAVEHGSRLRGSAKITHDMLENREHIRLVSLDMNALSIAKVFADE